MEQILQTSTLISIFLVLGAFVACGLCIVRLYNHSLPVVYPTPKPLPIGGWLIVIAILEIFVVISYLSELFSLQIWVSDFWIFVPNEFAPEHYYLMMVLNILYALNVVFTLCGASFTVYLMFTKRDILPKVLTWYSVISTSVYAAIEIIKRLTTRTPIDNDFLARSVVIGTMIGILINILIMVLIIRYVHHSVRAKETFVLPHPSLVDYEDPEFLKDLK